MSLNQQHKSHLSPNIFMLLILLGLPRRQPREVVVETDLESVSSLWIFCSLSLFKQHKSCSNKHIKTALGLKRSAAWISYCPGRNRVILNIMIWPIWGSPSPLQSYETCSVQCIPLSMANGPLYFNCGSQWSVHIRLVKEINLLFHNSPEKCPEECTPRFLYSTPSAP